MKYLLFLTSCLALFSGNAFCSGIPRYTIDLDLPPEQRFVEVSTKYSDYLKRLREVLTNIVPAQYFPLCEKIAASVDEYFPQPFADELRGIAKAANVSLGDVVLFNLFYDSTAYCTSIVARDSKGNILHGRNFDYDFLGFLRKVTFVADFKSKDTVVYTGVMFAGFVGLATAQKPHHFSMTLDERDQGFWWENAFEALFNRKAKIIGFLSRELLATATNFSEVIDGISKAELIAPVYFIIGGVKPMEGAVVTHNRETVADIWYIGSDKERWYLVETNYDHWTTPAPGDDRRDPAEKAMNSTGQANISPATLQKVLSVHPVLNNSTVYTTIMSAAQPDLFYTFLPDMN